MKVNIYILLIVVLITFSSCFKEDEKVTPHTPGDVSSSTVKLGQYYTYQVYFDLGTGMDVSSNTKDSWNLGFYANDEGWHIILNSSMFMYAANSGSTDFSAVTDTSGLVWKFDNANGDPDSTAIGEWLNITSTDTSYPKMVYVIDLGLNEMGIPQGLKKIVFEELKNDQYSFKFANVDGSEEYSFTVTKDPSLNIVCFSFEDGGKQIEIQPEKIGWDLLFTQYTDLLYTDENEPYPYIVTGVLLNSNKVIAAFDTTMNFNDITIDNLLDFEFSSDQNKIGYDWKYYNFDDAVYTVYTDYNYIVRDVGGYYYKLRFIGFYNNMGEKGYPTFEYQQL